MYFCLCCHGALPYEPQAYTMNMAGSLYLLSMIYCQGKDNFNTGNEYFNLSVNMLPPYQQFTVTQRRLNFIPTCAAIC